MRLIDDAHAALAELAHDAVRAELSAGGKGHGKAEYSPALDRRRCEFSTGDFCFFTFALAWSTGQLACGKVG